MKEKVIILKNNRGHVLSKLKAQGVRVKSDLGSILIIEEPTSKLTLQSLASAKIQLSDVQTELKKVKGLKPEEQLLVNAALLRRSPEFIKRKKAQVSGASPEEKIMFQGGCDHNH